MADPAMLRMTMGIYDRCRGIQTMIAKRVLIGVFCVVLATSVADAQTSGNVGFGSAGQTAAGSATRTQGLEQTGQLTSEAAFSRDPSAFVGGSSGNFLSQSGAPTGSGSTFAGFSTSSLSNTLSGLGNAGLFSLGVGANRGGFGGGNFNSGNRNSMMNQNQTTNTPQVRMTLSLGFTPRPYTSTEVSSRFTSRLPRIPGLSSATGVDAKMDGRTVVLQGVVASSSQRELVERLALLEPGISAVRNELVVAPEVVPPQSTPATETPAAATP
jgi:hypothetical protein